MILTCLPVGLLRCPPRGLWWAQLLLVYWAGKCFITRVVSIDLRTHNNESRVGRVRRVDRVRRMVRVRRVVTVR